MSALLSELKAPGTYTIIAVNGPEMQRLMEMGIMPGRNIEVVRSAPLGFPIEIKIRGYLLSLREAEAKYIEIKN